MNKIFAEIRLVLGAVLFIALCSAMMIKMNPPKMGVIDNGIYHNRSMGIQMNVDNHFSLLVGEQLNDFEDLAWNEFPITTTGKEQIDLVAVLAHNEGSIESSQEILVFSEKIESSLLVRNSWDYLHQWQNYYTENNEAYIIDECLDEKIVGKRLFNILDVSLFIEGRPIKCRIYSTMIDDKAYTLAIKSPSLASDIIAENTVNSLQFL